MSTGAGIAVAGIWIAVAIIGYRSPDAGALMGLFAIVPTLALITC